MKRLMIDDNEVLTYQLYDLDYGYSIPGSRKEMTVHEVSMANKKLSEEGKDVRYMLIPSH